MNLSREIRIVFIGCVEEGRRSLETLLDMGENILAVFTLTPERAAKTSGAVPWEEITRTHKIPLHYVDNINDSAPMGIIRDLGPDLVFCIGWTQLLKQNLLDLPRIGCLGFHASLLPRYRGRAPVNWAILHGEKETGNTLMLLDAGVDTGDILAQRRFPILEDDTCATIYDKVAVSEDEMIREVLPLIHGGNIPRQPQDHSLATIMPKRRPRDGIIDWNRTTRELHDWVRAQTHPYPGAFTWLGERKIRIWKASPILTACTMDDPPGFWKLSEPGGPLVVTTGDGSLRLERVQAAEDEELDGTEFACKYLPINGQQAGDKNS